MAGNERPVDDLIARIRRVLGEDVAALLRSAADPEALAAQVRAHLAALLSEAEHTLRTLRADAEQWRQVRLRAQQAAAAEMQLATIGAEQAQTAVVVAARERAERQHREAVHAESEERRLHGWIDALLAVVVSLRALFARLTERPDSDQEAPAGSEYMSRAAALAAEIDIINENALRKVREMRARAAGMSLDNEN